MAATHDVQRVWASPSNTDVFDEIEVAANAKIYAGCAVGVDANGWADVLDTAAHNKFAGFCVEQIDNTGGANGAVRVNVRRGRVFLPIAGSTRANFGAAVFASDDDTFSLTNGGSDVQIGSIDSCNDAGTPMVALERT